MIHKYIVIQDGIVRSSRDGEEICVGEIDNTERLEVGMELIDGVWQFPVSKPNYEEVRARYIKAIQEAQLLGETIEVTRLQQEWEVKKLEFDAP